MKPVHVLWTEQIITYIFSDTAICLVMVVLVRMKVLTVSVVHLLPYRNTVLLARMILMMRGLSIVCIG